VAGVATIPELEVMGSPEMSVVAIQVRKPSTVNIYKVWACVRCVCVCVCAHARLGASVCDSSWSPYPCPCASAAPATPAQPPLAALNDWPPTFSVSD